LISLDLITIIRSWVDLYGAQVTSDEQMGRLVHEQLAKEGVDVIGVKTDPDRLTALVLLGNRE